MSLTKDISAWSADLEFEDIPTRVVRLAKLQVASVVAALYAGYGHEGGQRVYRVASAAGGDGATLLPNGEKSTPANAIWAHASYSVVHDFDDYVYAGHTGHSAVLASLAFSEREGSSGRDFIVSQTIANELGGRLGGAMLFGPQNGQMWSYIHNLGAATAGARLMRLDRDGVRRAIGIAFLQPPFALSPGFFGGESKLLIASEPAAAGARAAELAREGMSGPQEALAEDQGFLRRFAGHPLDWMFTGLGSSWCSDSMTYKVVPGCAYIDGAVDCLYEVRDDFRDKLGRDLQAADVKRINVWGSVLTIGMEALCGLYCSKEDPTTIGVNFSVPMSLAVTILAGELVPEAISPWFLSTRKKEISELASRINLEHDSDLTRALGGLGQLGVDMTAAIAGVDPRDLGRLARGRSEPRGTPADRVIPDLTDVSFEDFKMQIPGRLVLETAPGDEFSAEVAIPRGAAGRPIDETEALVRAKFMRNAGLFLGDEQAAGAWDVIMGLEDLPSVEPLIRALVRPPGTKSAPRQRTAGAGK